ncbi:MAG: ABC transporter permease [Treponema sp.]|jgi:simple sugar transport system permease protein|nr:ABC transporter permease [Treponema sp.]
MNNSRLKQKIPKAAGEVFRQIILIIISLLFTVVFLALSGYEPFAVINGIIESLTSDIAGTVRWATPLILAGLAFCVSRKAGFFNLGIDGQIYLGAVTGVCVALLIPEGMSHPLGVVLVLIAAMTGGALFALIPAFMRVYLHTDEVVSTLLLNFVGSFFVRFLVNGPMRDPGNNVNLNASPLLARNTWLPRLSFLAPSSANAGIYIAIAMVILIAFVFYQTTLGHEIKITGSNPLLARYSGIQPNRIAILVMMFSGAVAGMIGAIEVFAVQHRLLADFNPSFGFDGIVVALLGNNNPIGIFFSGLFFGALRNGGINMERATDVPSAVTKIVMAIIIIIISIKITLPMIRKKPGAGYKAT